MPRQYGWGHAGVDGKVLKTARRLWTLLMRLRFQQPAEGHFHTLAKGPAHVPKRPAVPQATTQKGRLEARLRHRTAHPRDWMRGLGTRAASTRSFPLLRSECAGLNPDGRGPGGAISCRGRERGSDLGVLKSPPRPEATPRFVPGSDCRGEAAPSHVTIATQARPHGCRDRTRRCTTCPSPGRG